MRTNQLSTITFIGLSSICYYEANAFNLNQRLSFSSSSLMSSPPSQHHRRKMNEKGASSPASSLIALHSSTFRDDERNDERVLPTESLESNQTDNPLADGSSSQGSNSRDEKSKVEIFMDGIPFVQLFKADGYKKLPPIQVEDTSLLFYDVFLIVNLILSISFWVTHRMSLEYIPYAFSEGCLISILWIVSGLYHGAFLMSSVDGHYGSLDERGGPKAAAILAMNTFVNAINLRLVFALAVALIEHRQVGISPGEQLLPLEIGFGIILMTSWRALHSYITPRI